MDFNEIMRMCREKAGFSQREAAERLGITKSTYSRYENGESCMSVDDLRKFINLYGIDLNDVFKEEFPIVRTILYPKELLDNCEEVMKETSAFSNDWNENRKNFNLLRLALKPLLKIRDTAFDFSETDFRDISVGTITKEVKVDIRGEEIISRCLKLQAEYCKILFGE
ncbi:helix-turn-helix domain-containing protein [[Clostridium] innocuum]|nr:helix-turn-helix domain-containing protein [[Clostridium] innocuum]MCR0371936.1 helix-turn-helix domain-containing protein [[Clostridium] innocuum]MCR0375997.1 helix-turn-helix domain-containing protein [[Clostridium] innocuum]MCR0561248.1 helix-turn-helix domain-containing protein [[Clostridium] innocuum]MCR0604546.1 helix-turn-helix domain-containing protein [[Clostridium] innocuum]